VVKLVMDMACGYRGHDQTGGGGDEYKHQTATEATAKAASMASGGVLAISSLRTTSEVMFGKLEEKYEELMLLWMGSRPYVVVSSLRMAMEYLKTHDQEFVNRPVSVVRDYVSCKDNSIISMSAGNLFYQRLYSMFGMELLLPMKCFLQLINIAASKDLWKD
jgi:hypothetical protein